MSRRPPTRLATTGSAHMGTWCPGSRAPAARPGESAGVAEVRRPLLDECPNALAPLGVGGGLGDEPGLVVQLLVQRPRGRPADQRPRAHHRPDRPGGDLVRERDRGRAQVVVLDQAGDQAVEVSLGGTERAVAQYQVQRARSAECPGEGPGRAAVGAEPDGAVGGSDLRRPGTDDEVAGPDEPDAGPGPRSLDAGNHWHGGVEQRPDDLVPVVGELAHEGAGILRAGEGADVPADAEPWAVAQEEHGAGVLRPGRQGRGESGGEPGCQGVAGLGAVEGDPPDVAVRLGQYLRAVLRLGHRRSSRPGCSRHRRRRERPGRQERVVASACSSLSIAAEAPPNSSATSPLTWSSAPWSRAACPSASSPASAAASVRCAVERTRTATSTAVAPTANGTCTPKCSASLPAAKGARPPPRKRTKP